MILISFREIKPTKTNLIDLQQKVAFAIRGERFLEFKREQIIFQIKKVWEEYKANQNKLIDLHKKSLVKLNQAYKEMGKRDFILFSQMSKIQFSPKIDIKYKRKTGILIPSIKYNLDRENKLPAYSFEGSSHFIDDLIIILVEFFQRVIKFAETESIILNNTFNFKKINRRINGLNNMIIPNLETDIKKIKEKLEEIDRENFVRLKKTKDLIEKKKLKKSLNVVI